MLAQSEHLEGHQPGPSIIITHLSKSPKKKGIISTKPTNAKLPQGNNRRKENGVKDRQHGFLFSFCSNPNGLKTHWQDNNAVIKIVFRESRNHRREREDD